MDTSARYLVSVQGKPNHVVLAPQAQSPPTTTKISESRFLALNACCTLADISSLTEPALLPLNVPIVVSKILPALEDGEVTAADRP